VQFVRSRHQQRVRSLTLDVGKVGLLAGAPWRLGPRVSVGAGAHDASDARTEPVLDHRVPLHPTILDRIMQQGGAGLVLVAAVLQHD